jgi:TRAP-type C4-dicarboxylate transport system permease small subunit
VKTNVAPERTTRSRKLLVVSLASVAAFAFLLAIGSYSYWLRHSPSQPRADTGQIYALNQHGYLFYVTYAQSRVFSALLVVFGVFGLAAGVLNLRWKALASPIDDAPKKFY